MVAWWSVSFCVACGCRYHVAGKALFDALKVGGCGYQVSGKTLLAWFADKANLGWTDLPTKPTTGGLICRQSQQRVDWFADKANLGWTDLPTKPTKFNIHSNPLKIHQNAWTIIQHSMEIIFEYMECSNTTSSLQFITFVITFVWCWGCNSFSSNLFPN